jgi:hypothetical protein
VAEGQIWEQVGQNLGGIGIGTYQQWILISETCCLHPQAPLLTSDDVGDHRIISLTMTPPWQLLVVPQSVIPQSGFLSPETNVIPLDSQYHPFIAQLKPPYRNPWSRHAEVLPLVSWSPDIVADVESEIRGSQVLQRVLVVANAPELPYWQYLTQSRFTYLDPQTLGTLTPPISHSFQVNPSELDLLPRPDILDGTYDLIIIRHGTSHDDTQPGRWLFLYWIDAYYSHPGSLLYLTDTHQLVEHYWIQWLMHVSTARWTINHEWQDKEATVKLRWLKT